MMNKALHSTPYFFEFKGQCAPLPVVVSKRKGARSMVLRYQPVAQALTLTLPWHVSVSRGLKFIEEKRAWVLRELTAHPQKVPFTDGQTIPVLGAEYKIVHVGGRGVVTAIPSPRGGGLGRGHDSAQQNNAPLLTSPLKGGGIIEVPGDEAFMARRVCEWIKKQTEHAIRVNAEEKAEKLGCKIKKITLRDTRSLWGSCTSGGNLSFSWRLAFASPEVLDYLVAHEVAHLAELNHGPAFWKTVGELCPHWKKSRRWIKKYGNTLYRYG